jgi:hypothetical protein
MASDEEKASAAMFPEYVAARCVDGVMRVHRGDKVSRRVARILVFCLPWLLFYYKIPARIRGQNCSIEVRFGSS